MAHQARPSRSPCGHGAVARTVSSIVTQSAFPVRRAAPHGTPSKVVLLVDQQAHDLALGDADADRLERRDQTLDGHLTLVILHQHEAAQLRAKMAGCRWAAAPRSSGRAASASARVDSGRPRGRHQLLPLG